MGTGVCLAALLLSGARFCLGVPANRNDLAYPAGMLGERPRRLSTLGASRSYCLRFALAARGYGDTGVTAGALPLHPARGHCPLDPHERSRGWGAQDSQGLASPHVASFLRADELEMMAAMW